MSCGETVSPTYAAVSVGGGCRWCNDPAIDPVVAARTMVEEGGVIPQGPYTSANHDWPCICTRCGRPVTPR